jgi:chaperone BCS1
MTIALSSLLSAAILPCGRSAHLSTQTNYYERLDPALVRPGRIDMKVEYHHATSSQAMDLFNRFFPASRFAPETASDVVHHEAARARDQKTPQFMTSPKRPLTDLATAFASGVPEGEFTAAELQGFLLRCKWNPELALSGLAEWVEEVRSDRLSRSAHKESERRKRREKRAARKGTNLMPPAPGASDVSRLRE